MSVPSRFRLQPGDDVVSKMLSLVGAIVTGFVTAVFSGLAGIPAGVANAASALVRGFASFLAELTASFFGLADYLPALTVPGIVPNIPRTVGGAYASAAAQLKSFGPLAFPVALVFVAVLVWAVARTLDALGGESSG